MITAQFKNLLIFVAVVLVNIGVISVAAALGADTMPGFREGELLRPARGEAIALLAIVAPIISGWIVQNRPRFGSEQLAAEMNAYRELGYARADLTVVPKRDRLDLIRELERLTPSEREELSAELERHGRLPSPPPSSEVR